ncbi:hypothetical protein V8J36_07995 [Frigidibacter sp. MR17.14]|uniref:hypothetical protein n=1 Tax=Frigidibacter sp. MR17.14 TaxID=3126509 RepID=UPI003012C674
MKDFDPQETIGLFPLLRDVGAAKVALETLRAPAHPLVLWAEEEIFWCECGLSTLERVREAVETAASSVIISRSTV